MNTLNNRIALDNRLALAAIAAALAALVLVGGSSVGDAVGSVTSHTVILLVAAFVVVPVSMASVKSHGGTPPASPKNGSMSENVST